MSSIAQGQYLRANYRLTGGKANVGALESALVRLRISVQYDSGAAAGVLTFSLNGYGVASWALVDHATIHTTLGLLIGNPSIDIANCGSIMYVTVADGWSNSTAVASGGSSVPMASLAATVTFVIEVLALIASR